MAQNDGTRSENLKLYDEIIAVRNLCANQEKDLIDFDVTWSSLPMENSILIKEISSLIFETGVQNIDKFTLETLFYEALKDRIEYTNVVKKLQLENMKLEELISQEIREIKSLEDGKTDLLKNIVPLSETTKEINILEKQIGAMQEKQLKCSSSSLKWLDQLLLKLDQINLKKNSN